MGYFRGNVNDQRNPLMGAILRSLQETGEISIPALRSLSPLSDKAQVLVDQAVVEVGLERLAFVKDLLDMGLVYNLTDPLSVTQVEWDSESKAGGAQRTMTPSSRTENMLLDRKHNRVPIFCTTDGFSMGIRLLKMSERTGQPLDLSQIKQATRRVNEAFEDAAINGATTPDGQTFNDGGYTAPGLLNAPNVNSGNTTVDWTAANSVGTTGPAMMSDILAGVSVLQGDLKFGPYKLVIGTKAANVISGDFKANGDSSIRQRLENMDVGGGKLSITVADRMPAGTVSGTAQFALVQMTSDVVEIINGQPPTIIPWTSPDGLTLYWLVLGIQVPRMRSDYDGNSGIYLGLKT